MNDLSDRHIINAVESWLRDKEILTRENYNMIIADLESGIK